MYNLATVNTEEYSIPDSLNLRGFNFSDEKHLFHQLDHIHGVIIRQKKGKDPSSNFELMLSIKRHSSLPIWIIDETENRVNRKLTIELGAIGVLDPKFSDEEMFVLIKNTMDLIYPKALQNTTKETKKGNLKLNAQNHSIQLPNQTEVSLTNLEYKLLALLDTRVNQAFTYENIYSNIWNSKRETELSEKKYRIANMVFHIRNKLKHHDINPNVLRTVRSVGYLLDTNVEIIHNERGGGNWGNTNM